MKSCYKCKTVKPFNEFHKDRTKKGGIGNRCKKCAIRMSLEWYISVGRFKRDKAYFSERKDQLKIYNRYSYRKEILKRYSSRNSNKIQARQTVWKALKRGLISKKPCIACGEKKVEAHHYKGYEKDYWLTVEWLCVYHHKQQHFKYPK